MEFKFDWAHASGKQLEFLRSTQRFIAYGGARGGGKTWAMREVIVLLALRYAGIKILVLRRTYGELQDGYIAPLSRRLLNIARYTEMHKQFKFINDSVIKLGYCASERDVLQYQGVEFDVICIDEATQFSEQQFLTLSASVRGANPFPKRMYLTCNPGGIGHQWVKRLFIKRDYTPTENPQDYHFIPATVHDNKILLRHNPEYLTMLDNLHDGLREMWRDGNWDTMAGQYFAEFRRDVHVVAPFGVPKHWKRYRAIDYGLDCLACLWFAVDELGNIYVYREYAQPDKTYSTGSADILALSVDEKIEYTVAPSDLFARSRESAKRGADLFRESGLTLLQGSNNRVTGWLAVKNLLTVKNDDARLKIFSTCTELIECIPSLLHDTRNPDDAATEPHDITHLPDALRYFVLQYVTPSKPIKPAQSELDKHFERVHRGNKRYY